jgi:hypothetical protein
MCRSRISHHRLRSRKPAPGVRGCEWLGAQISSPLRVFPQRRVDSSPERRWLCRFATAHKGRLELDQWPYLGLST